MRWILATLALGLVVSPAGPSAAQDARSVRISLESLTVDGRSPPDPYRGLLARGVRPTLDDALGCYRARLAELPELHGELRLRLWVSARQVIRVTPEEPLSDAALQACAIARVRAFRLPPEAPSAGATVRFLLRFARGPRAAPARPDVVVAETEGPAARPFDARASRTVTHVVGPRPGRELEAALPASAFAACSQAPGRLELALDVSREGTIDGRRVGGTFDERGAERCALAVLRGVRLAGTTDATTACLILTYAD